MGRKPTVWRRAERGGVFFTTISGQQISLETKSERVAKDRLAKLLAEKTGGENDQDGITFAMLAARFLEDVRQHRAAATYDEHRLYLSSFSAALGKLRTAASVIPYDVSTWLDGFTTRPSVRRAATKSAKRCFAWGVEQGLVRDNPLHRIKLGPRPRSTRTLLPEQTAALLSGCLPHYRPLIELGLETGMRAQELRRIEARHVHGDRIVFESTEHKTGSKTGRQRVVYLTARAQAIVAAAAADYPSGPLFRNRLGKAISANALRKEFWSMANRGIVPRGTRATTLRHTFVTEALRRGVNPEAVRQLVGHADLSMIAAVYSHLDQHTDHLRREAERATGAG